MDERRRRGLEKFTEVAGLPAMEPPDAFVAATIDHVFGEVWQDDALSVRDRRLMTLAILGALGSADEARVHLKAALESGDVTPSEMMAVVMQVATYAGFPRGSAFYRAFRQVAGELGLEVPAD